MKLLIRKIRKDQGLTLEQLAEMAGISRSYLTELELGAKTINANRLEQVAKALKVNASDLIERITDSVSIAGAVGAGAQVPVFDAYEKGDGPQVECPPGLSPHGVVAVEVCGDSMEPVYSEGDLLFYSRNSHDGVPAEVVGHRCVCEDEEGMGWVKVIKEGREPGTFDLHSINSRVDPMYGVKLKWAGRVRLHWPADLVKRKN